MKTVFKVMLGIVLGFTVLIVGCAVLIGGAANEVQKQSDKTSITVVEYGSAKVGQATRSQLEKRFGNPQTSDEIQTDDVSGIPKSAFKQSCIYYNRTGQIASLFQFCFDGAGKLTSKSSF